MDMAGKMDRISGWTQFAGRLFLDRDRQEISAVVAGQRIGAGKIDPGQAQYDVLSGAECGKRAAVTRPEFNRHDVVGLVAYGGDREGARAGPAPPARGFVLAGVATCRGQRGRG